MEYIAILILIVLWIVDSCKTSSYKRDSFYRDQKDNYPAYWDDKGKQYSVKTGKQVVSCTVYRPIPDSAPGNYYWGYGFKNAGNGKLDSIIENSWGESCRKYKPIREKFFKEAYINGAKYYY